MKTVFSIPSPLGPYNPGSPRGSSHLSHLPAVHLPVAIMYRCVAALVVLLHLASALYYKPLPLQCSVEQKIQYDDQVVQVRHIEAIQAPLPVPHVHLETVFATSMVPVTSVSFVTLTVDPVSMEVSQPVVVPTTVDVVLTAVQTVTKELTETSVNVITSTATNYHTEFATRTLVETLFHTTSLLDTTLVQRTVTKLSTQLSTVTVTQNQLQTKVEVRSVPRTVLVTATRLQPSTSTSTHYLTKMVTQMVCPHKFNH